MTFKLGLTGSIGMGKSTTAQIFAEAGCAIWDADAAVHRLYDVGGGAVAQIAQVFPEVIKDDAISRSKLKILITNRSSALSEIEQIVHPLVAQDRRKFLDNTTADIAVLDIPLLYETGGDRDMDAVVCVTISPDIQRQRVLARGTMKAAQFEAILCKQMPDAEKRALADYVITTDTLEHTHEQVQVVIADIRGKLGYA